MVFKGNLDCDPRGLIYEAYRMDGLTIEESRSIFLDWALGAPAGDVTKYLGQFLETYGADNPDHPMTSVIKEGQAKAARPKRRGGARARR